MKNRNFLNFPKSIAISLLLIGCGTWIGNPKKPDGGGGSEKSSVSLEFQGNVGAAQLAATSVDVVGKTGSKIGTIELSTAKVAFEKIKIKAKIEDANTPDEFNGPFVIDLLSNQTTPNPGTIEVSSAGIEDIQIVIKKLEAEKAGISESDPLNKNSIYLAGTYTDVNGAVKSFKMTMDLDEEISLAGFAKKNKQVVLSADALNKIIIAFQLSRWFDFSDLESNSDGFDFSQITASSIDLKTDAPETEKKIREVIKKNIEQSARFGKDDDGDGKLGKHENNDDEDDGD